MSADNVYRDTTAVDLLNKTRLDQQEKNAANTAANNFTPDHVIQPSDILNITDDAQVNNTQSSASDALNITDSVANLALNSGSFQFDGDFFCGNGYVPARWYGAGKTAGDFDSSSPGGFNEPTNPLRFSFGDFG